MKQIQCILLTLAVATAALACGSPVPADDTKTQETPAAAASTTADNFPAGKVIDTVACHADPSQTYALYIPSTGNTNALPIIYCFDPHAAGSLPLTKYKGLADEYGFILVGSNNSKNGNDWPTADNIWQQLYNDTRQRLKVNDNRIYTCGFSGGAKVASYIALKYPGIKGVIVGGAGLPDGSQAANFNFTFTALAGEGDMNMTDLVAITSALDKTSTRHRIILFNGKHEWAPGNVMNKAFAGVQLDAMFQSLIPKDSLFINTCVAREKKQLDSLLQKNMLIKAGEECNIATSYFDGLTIQAAWFKQQATALAANGQYQKQIQQQQALFAKEDGIKQMYQQQFQQGDINYWLKTINDLNTQASAKTFESPMYQRLLAYLSLAFYSISNQFINSNQNDGAQYFVGLYKLADPTNSEAWYFSAILNARKQQTQAAQSDLLKAAACGFTDKNRMLQQPDFQALTTPINFSIIESKMVAD